MFGKRHASGAYHQIFITVKLLRVCWCGALSDERTGLWFTIAVSLRQLSHSRVRVPWDWRPYFTVTDTRLPFLSPPTTRRAMVELLIPPSHSSLTIQNYFTTGGSPPISSSWCQTLWGSWPEILFQLIAYDDSPYVASSLTRRWVCLLWICLAFRQVYISHM
jgi:hypothetical protein